MEDFLKNHVLVCQERYEQLLDLETRLDIFESFVINDHNIDIVDVCRILGLNSLAQSVKQKQEEEEEKHQQEMKKFWDEYNKKEMKEDENQESDS